MSVLENGIVELGEGICGLFDPPIAPGIYFHTGALIEILEYKRKTVAGLDIAPEAARWADVTLRSLAEMFEAQMFEAQMFEALQRKAEQ